MIDSYFNLIKRRNMDANLLSINVTPVNFYKLLVEKGYDSVKHMTEGMNIFYCHLLFIPIYDGYNMMLWVFDIKKRKVTLYNPRRQKIDFSWNKHAMVLLKSQNTQTNRVEYESTKSRDAAGRHGLGLVRK